MPSRTTWWHYLDVVRAVHRATTLPLAVKLSPYFSAVANMAGQLVEAGADGLVLFNRFYQPDLDIEAMEMRRMTAARLADDPRLARAEVLARHQPTPEVAAASLAPGGNLLPPWSVFFPRSCRWSSRVAGEV